ncbi:MAG: DUF5684 domain-containing protein, partial [Bacteroidales bacterium]|nr:DUF5684 domain-containing protein [Bacteroidales bacterium]
MIIVIIIYVAIIIFMIAAMWKIYSKANQPGWACLVPIYNLIVLLDIVGKPRWWIILLLIVPFANVICGIWVINLLSKSFGKETGFTLGLLFLGIIFYPILGFGSAEYKGPAGLGAKTE